MATGLLSKYSTFGIGGPAKCLVEVQTAEQMVAAVRQCREEQERFLVIGKGSNTLFDDRGFDGTVLINRIEYWQQEGSRFKAGAGLSFPLLGIKAAKAGYAGLEFAAGIPGSVGGAVVMNAGADGAEIATVLESVTVLESDGQVICVPRAALSYSYRTSPFQHSDRIVLAATFRLTPCSEARTRQIDLVVHRKQKQPLRDKSVGCIFRNPPHQSAGALIEQCGLKGIKIGGAQVSWLHANFIVNVQGATSSDIQGLIACIQESVQMRTGICLQHEVRVIPYE